MSLNLALMFLGILWAALSYGHYLQAVSTGTFQLTLCSHVPLSLAGACE